MHHFTSKLVTTAAFMTTILKSATLKIHLKHKKHIDASIFFMAP